MKLTLTALAAKSTGIQPNPYGCWNRNPIVTVSAPTCQYTLSSLGQADTRCVGCKERVNGA